MAQQRLEATKHAAQTIEMEVESGSEDESDEETKTMKEIAKDAAETSQTQNPKPKFPSEVSQPIPAPPNPDNVVIRKDYNPRTKQVCLLIFCNFFTLKLFSFLNF